MCRSFRQYAPTAAAIKAESNAFLATTQKNDVHPDTTLPLAVDLSKRDQIVDGVKRAKDAFGRIDTLVNNAGQGYLSAIEEGEDERIRHLFEVNYFGIVTTIQAVLPTMRAQGPHR